MEVAKVALDNEDFANAAKVYTYVIREYQNSENYLMARLGLRSEPTKPAYEAPIP